MGEFDGNALRSRGALVGGWWVVIGVCVCALACGASSSSGAAEPDDQNDVSTNGTDTPGDEGDQTNTPIVDNADDDDAGNGDATTKPLTTKGGAQATPKALKTTKPPAVLTKWLEKPAARALKKQIWPLAISYYRGLVEARGASGPDALRLVQALVQESQFGEARAILKRFVDTTPHAEKRRAQLVVLARLKDVTDPYTTAVRKLPATADAVKAFNKGRAAFKKKQYGDAVLYFRVGIAMDPDLAGIVRELGVAYDALGMKKKTVEMFTDYLRRRPFGKNADFVRTQLAKHKGVTGTLTITSSLPCDHVWLSAQPVPKKKKKKKKQKSPLPVKKLLLGPGKVTALCWNVGYEIAYFQDARVVVGKDVKLHFSWAVVVNGLNPPGRIRIENALDRSAPKVAVPLSKKQGFGVVVPANGRALEVELTSMDRQRQITRDIKFVAGKKEVIKW